jgi:hypothetical protein
MHHRTWLSAFLLTALAAAAVVPAARAQGTVTLYGGARSSAGLELAGSQSSGGGTPREVPPREVQLRDSSMVGVALGWALDAQRDGEVLLTQQKSRLRTTSGLTVPLTVHSAQLGGVVHWQEDSPGRGPYAAGGIGLTHFMPDLAGFGSATRPSLSLGLGYQWRGGAGRVALRAEARGHVVLINSAGEFLCSGGCSISIRGDTLTQGDLMLGLHLRF